ncbi:peptidylprolyl isomerase [Aquamicrobium sp. LC103]|uniref:SurA N-terminal domain-containing protein n=1 Tax=Aquamicrobium sp. LC103 TaxID=1120658 RepID=UPI00063EC648|nr:peptidylprolyl isomerase [Aquamicrobium sp. LC103]TKT81358.1 peptidylprolyl isomerase [Aquamicrobium sp. LC103]
MMPIRKSLRTIALALMVSAVTVPVAFAPLPAAATEIKYVVNNQPVTSYDIQRRAAFLKLQQRKGNLQQMAADDMVDQALRTAEIKRLNIRITDEQVADSYARFAQSNNLSPQQMDEILAQTGVTKAHFREFIRTQMGWGQAINARSRSANRMSEQDVVQRMLQQGGNKPSATEYMLQQVIFVVPASERGAKLAARKREAEAMRQRFRSCDTTREFVKGLLDVTVRDLGRILQPELPPEWKESVTATNAGAATAVRETDRGVEFIGVCSAREVSDDRVAQMVFQAEGTGGEKADELSKEYTAELREKATIINR